MTDREAYYAWAPPDALWSPWAKPVLFGWVDDGFRPPFPPLGTAKPYARWMPQARSDTALLLDLPGAHGITRALQMAAVGFRPVPLFNTTPGMDAVVPVDDLVNGLRFGANELGSLVLPPSAPPAFLIDANRQRTDHAPLPGRYDNRWLVFPQDFPSASKLAENGITQVVLCQADQIIPREDLAHVLLRWQEAGIAIRAYSETEGESPQTIAVARPGHFRSLLYRAFALAGLRRNSAGGFGGIIPEPGSGYG